MGIPELLVTTLWLLVVVVPIWPTARICGRMGFSPWLALLIVVPVGNLVLLFVLAYAPWPIDDARPRPRAELA